MIFFPTTLTDAVCFLTCIDCRFKLIIFAETTFYLLLYLISRGKGHTQFRLDKTDFFFLRLHWPHNRTGWTGGSLKVTVNWFSVFVYWFVLVCTSGKSKPVDSSQI